MKITFKGLENENVDDDTIVFTIEKEKDAYLVTALDWKDKTAKVFESKRKEFVSNTTKVISSFSNFVNCTSLNMAVREALKSIINLEYSIEDVTLSRRECDLLVRDILQLLIEHKHIFIFSGKQGYSPSLPDEINLDTFIKDKIFNLE